MPVERGSPVALVSTAAVGVPSAGVTKVGLVPKTKAPEPVSSVTAPARFALEGVAKNVATLVPRPETPVEIGKPVAFVRVSEVGTPIEGVSSLIVVKESTTAPELPLPSEQRTLVVPVGMVTVAPDPCFMVRLWLPVVAFSIIHTLETVFGARVSVRVAVRATAEVNLRYIDRRSSAAALGIVNVSSASAASSRVPYPNASVISARFRLFETPHVLSLAPVAVSSKRKLLR
jgi:hypothetical protein